MAPRWECSLHERTRFKTLKGYWLLKSEPYVWSIDQQKKAGLKGATWEGVRNYQAANNLKKMNLGNAKEKYKTLFIDGYENVNYSKEDEKFMLKNKQYCKKNQIQSENNFIVGNTKSKVKIILLLEIPKAIFY